MEQGGTARKVPEQFYKSGQSEGCWRRKVPVTTRSFVVLSS